MRTATVDTGRHIHVVDGQTVAILDVSQPVPKVRRRRRRIAGIARYRVFDRGADIVGYADQVPYRVGLGRDPQKQGHDPLTAAAFKGGVTGECTKQGRTQAVDVGRRSWALALE